MSHKHKTHAHHHSCGWGAHLTLWHADGNRLSIPWWVLITALNIGIWWWQPLLLVLAGTAVAAWLLGYRVGKDKRK